MEFGERSIGMYRQWFRDAADFWRKWQDEAREDFDFVEGRQWTESQIKKFEEKGRPALVINRIKPLINVLSGYQRLNRYSIGFAARTDDDVEICRVREGVTKYVLDSCDYDTNESNVFADSSISGLGWFFVGYEYEEETNNGEAYIRREDPFSIYPDPESHKADITDLSEKIFLKQILHFTALKIRTRCIIRKILKMFFITTKNGNRF